MIIFIQEVIQSHMVNLVLIVVWGAHLQNQRETLIDHQTFTMKLYILRLILRKTNHYREFNLQIILQ